MSRRAGDASLQRKNAKRVSKKVAHRDKYESKLKGEEREMEQALAALLAMYGSQVPR